MGNEKVAEKVALHCKGRTYGNSYLITSKAGSLRPDTFAPTILSLLEAPAEGFFWNLPELGHRI
jgi:hypothetical protein